jgi:hypothetical protein
LGHVAELFGQFEHANFGADDFLFLCHLMSFGKPWRGLHNPDQFRPRHGSIEPWKTPYVRLS